MSHNLLSADGATLNVGDSLTLKNCRFPYPPFRWYDVHHSDEVKESSIDTTGYSPGEGGSSYDTDTFTFSTQGTHQLKVKEYVYGTGREDVKRELTITVKVT